MTGLLFLFGLFLALGLYFLAAALLRLPTIGAARAMLGTVKQERKSAKTMETHLMVAAVRLADYIHMDEYKRSRMDNVLKASGMNLTPEVYQAYSLVKAGAVLLGIIPSVFLFPLLSPVVVILAVLVYFKESQKADERLKAKREEIEGELPRMVATIEQELKASRNVIGMLEVSFKQGLVPCADAYGSGAGYPFRHGGGHFCVGRLCGEADPPHRVQEVRQ